MPKKEVSTANQKNASRKFPAHLPVWAAGAEKFLLGAKAIREAIDLLPEPYRSAARLMPRLEWKFVLVAFLCHVMRDQSLTPQGRLFARECIRLDMALMIPEIYARKRGRPQDINRTDDPDLRYAFRAEYDRRLRRIHAAGPKHRPGDLAPAEQVRKDMTEAYDIGERALRKAIYGKQEPRTYATLEMLPKVKKPKRPR